MLNVTALNSQQGINPSNHQKSPQKNALPQNVAKVKYLDSHQLIKGFNHEPAIQPEHYDWFLNQAILLSRPDQVTEKNKKKLDLLTLLAFSKISSIGEKDVKNLNITSSPLFDNNYAYHRASRNPLLTEIDETVSKLIGVQPWEAQFVSSPLLAEVFERVYPHPKMNLKIGKREHYESIIDQLLADAKQGNYPNSRILIDFTDLLKNEAITPDKIAILVREMEDIFFDKLTLAANDELNKAHVSDKLMAMLQPVAFYPYGNDEQKYHLLITPNFFAEANRSEEDNQLIMRDAVWNKNGNFARELYSIVSNTGYRLSPSDAKAAWLSLKSLPTILKEQGIAQVELATHGDTIPNVCRNFKSFLNQPIIKKFGQLSELTSAPPYLKIIPKITVELLKGLKEFGITHKFSHKGLKNLLQMSYYRIINAMNEAILRKDNIIEFTNQIEIIHQEIQNILALISPYKKDAFANAVILNIANMKEPVIPQGLNISGVHLKASGMHTLTSALSSVEKMKGSNQLNVALLKNSYYKEGNALENSQAYKLSVIDSDYMESLLHSSMKKKHATSTKNDKALRVFDNPPKEPLDVLITEFHHNILSDKQKYRPEKVLEQVKFLIDNKLVAKNFTVVVDNTVDLVESQDLRKFLNDPEIQKYIEKGLLNVVLIRSAQKFDMMGLDNYYGGIAISINNSKSFARFNERMNHADDQLEGLDYQGLTHLHLHAGLLLDEYRQILMNNTQTLYSLLPKAAIHHTGQNNPLQISQIEDDKLFFLDFKFNRYPSTASAFTSALMKFAKNNHLPLTQRASFGFMTTTLTSIDDKIRLNVGMEKLEDLQAYASFIADIQKIIDGVLVEAEDSSLLRTEIDAIIAKRIKAMR